MELIDRKNEMLKVAAGAFDEVAKLSRALMDLENGMRHSNVTSDTILTICTLTGEKLRSLCFIRYDMRAEADRALPEAEQDDDPFLSMPTSDEIGDTREVNGDD